MPTLDNSGPAASTDVPARIRSLLDWDAEAGAGYLPLTAIGIGDAVRQHVVTNPVTGQQNIVLDFDVHGRLLGIEFLDTTTLPPGISTESSGSRSTASGTVIS